MASNGQRNPHLASILQNLGQLTQAPIPAHHHNLGDVPPDQINIRDGQSTQILRGNALPISLEEDDQRYPTPFKRDPTRITEWPPAVKFVMKSLANDPQVASKIKRLLKNQHDNERQWWAGREALIAKHMNRAESEKKVDDILRSLGGTSSNQSIENKSWSVEEGKDELRGYDKKIYAALGQLVTAMDKELATMGVPFFAIKHELVHDAIDKMPGRVSKTQLLVLQRKMLQLLEDSFAE